MVRAILDCVNDRNDLTQPSLNQQQPQHLAGKDVDTSGDVSLITAGAQQVTIQGGMFTTIGRGHVVNHNHVTVNHFGASGGGHPQGNVNSSLLCSNHPEGRTPDLGNLPPSTYEAIQRELYEKRAPGTGSAFLKRQKYQDWYEGKFKVLCATGMRKLMTYDQAAVAHNRPLAGAGKSHQALVHPLAVP